MHGTKCMSRCIARDRMETAFEPKHQDGKQHMTQSTRKSRDQTSNAIP